VRIKATVCRVVDLEELVPEEGESFRFRVEIRRLEENGLYDAVVYRGESFRVVPSFFRDASGNSIVADHEFFIVDFVFDPASFVSATEEGSLKLVLDSMDEMFGSLATGSGPATDA
jgi:hypothetical protein